jgi:hypothetical protein
MVCTRLKIDVEYHIIKTIQYSQKLATVSYSQNLNSKIIFKPIVLYYVVTMICMYNLHYIQYEYTYTDTLYNIMNDIKNNELRFL